MPFTYEYQHPAVTVDFVVFGVDLIKSELRVLLIQRADPPFEGSFALPGGFVEIDEDLDDAAKRELAEETGISKRFYMEQLRTFGAPNRDPRERVITVAYLALVDAADCRIEAGSDATSAKWYSARNPPHLAFDHQEILETAIERLEAKVRYAPVGFDLLPKRFSLGELQRLYEVILGRSLDKRNFRRRILEMGILNATTSKKLTTGRVAQLFSFNKKAYDRAVKQGFNFEV